MDPFTLFLLSLLGATAASSAAVKTAPWPMPQNLDEMTPAQLATWVDEVTAQLEALEYAYEEEQQQTLANLGLDIEDVYRLTEFFDPELLRVMIDDHIALLQVNRAFPANEPPYAQVSVIAPPGLSEPTQHALPEDFEALVFQSDEDAAEHVQDLIRDQYRFEPSLILHRMASEQGYRPRSSWGRGDDEAVLRSAFDRLVDLWMRGVSFEDWIKRNASDESVSEVISHEDLRDAPAYTLRPFELRNLVQLRRAIRNQRLSPVELAVAARRAKDAGNLLGTLMLKILQSERVRPLSVLQKHPTPRQAADLQRALSAMSEKELVAFDQMQERGITQGTPFDLEAIEKEIEGLTRQIMEERETDWYRLQQDLGFEPHSLYRVN